MARDPERTISFLYNEPDLPRFKHDFEKSSMKTAGSSTKLLEHPGVHLAKIKKYLAIEKQQVRPMLVPLYVVRRSRLARLCSSLGDLQFQHWRPIGLYLGSAKTVE